MVDEYAIKQAFSKVREDFELLRKEINEVKNSANGTSEIQDLKNKLEQLKIQLTEVVSPEDGPSLKINSTEKKEAKKKDESREQVISPEKVPISKESNEMEEDLQEVNALADEYY